jgi:hypothetical protein
MLTRYWHLYDCICMHTVISFLMVGIVPGHLFTALQ